MRGRKQSDLMTQRHLERALFLSFKEQITLTKHSNPPNPTPRIAAAPTHFSLYGQLLLLDHSISNTYVCVCMCVCAFMWVFADGRGLVQFTGML